MFVQCTYIVFIFIYAICVMASGKARQTNRLRVRCIRFWAEWCSIVEENGPEYEMNRRWSPVHLPKIARLCSMLEKGILQSTTSVVRIVALARACVCVWRIRANVCMVDEYVILCGRGGMYIRTYIRTFRFALCIFGIVCDAIYLLGW